MPEKAWKRFERTVAEKVGGIRVPVTGLDRDGADVIAPPFHYQCKLRKNVPVYLTTWLDGITATAAQSGSTGVVVWRAPGTLNDDALGDHEIIRLASPARQRPGSTEASCG